MFKKLSSILSQWLEGCIEQRSRSRFSPRGTGFESQYSLNFSDDLLSVVLWEIPYRLSTWHLDQKILIILSQWLCQIRNTSSHSNTEVKQHWKDGRLWTPDAAGIGCDTDASLRQVASVESRHPLMFVQCHCPYLLEPLYHTQTSPVGHNVKCNFLFKTI